jgi:polyvinyl alcohol dehydrogenase (cytochrome)
MRHPARQILRPDYDFGDSLAILETVKGKDILLAAGKSGVAVALDPDREGKLLSRTQLWETQAPSASGLVVWGGAAGGAHVYYPLQQPSGGLKALDIQTGRVDWKAAINADRRGQAGPASAIPGVVFTGGWDGILRAVDAEGMVIWSFSAVRDFDTINRVAAKGGSFGCAGAVIAGGMVFAISGYPGMLRGTPGKVLLAFEME